MQISNFNDFYATVAVFNLGFASYEGFRSVILDDILRLRFKKPSELTLIDESVKSSEILAKFGVLELLDKRIGDITGEHDEIQNALVDRAQIALNISEISKANFLYTGFYCLIMLIISGYQEILADASTNLFIFIFNFSFIFNVFVFLRSFPRFNRRKKQISPIITLSTLLCLLILSLFICTRKPVVNINSLSLPLNVGISLLFSISPYVLHFLRLFQHKMHYQPLLDKNEVERSNKMNDLNKALIALFFNGKKD